MKIDKTNLPKILSIIIGSLLAIVVLFIGFKVVSGLFTKAADAAPREVLITGITQNSAKLGWSTDQETQGVVEYGTSPTSLNFFAPEAAKGQKHTVDLSLLSPNTTYYFQVRIGDQKYDNGGVPWTFTTKAKGDAATTGTPTPSPSAAGITDTPNAPTVTSGASSSTGPIIRPTSGIHVDLPKPTNTPMPLPTLASFVCGETDCIKICQKIGKTCSSQDWMRSSCVGKVNLTTCTQVVPTNTPAPTAAPTNTPAPTASPTPTVSVTPTPTGSSSSSSSSSSS